jgi:glutamate 5-kinase
MLSALVASKMKADLLMILSVVDGLYKGDPGEKKSKGQGEGPILSVEELDEEVMGHAGKSKSGLGTGGMTSKLAAVRIAHLAGIHSVIAGGKTKGVIEQVLSGRFRGTYFAPQDHKQFKGRDRWIAFGRIAFGRKLVIDSGAREALVIGKKSLLPAGVREVCGTFERGDLVDIYGPDGQRVGKGLVNYDSAVLEQIKGKKSSQIREILGAVEYTEAIHRDNMAMLV